MKATHARLDTLACLILTSGICAAHAATAPLLSPLFGNHAVLQRGRPIRVWGRARPDERVSVSFAGKSAHARADASGRWQVRLPALRAGGPFVLTVRDSTQRVRSNDVDVGDVFLCSGQSNMELAVRYADRAFETIPASANASLRLIDVPHAISPTPLARLPKPLAWQAAAPATVPGWSAVCYFFGRDLQRRLHVPIGLVQSTWSGSQIQPWLSAAALRASGPYASRLELLRLYARNHAAAQRSFARRWQAWWRSKSGQQETVPWKADPGESAAARGWRPVPLPLRDWRLWGVPRLAHFTGLLWLRTTVTVTAGEAGKPATLALGPINQIDELWVNGRAVANTFGYNAVRTYRLPPGLLHAGRNDVVLNVLDTWGPGGLLHSPKPRELRFAGGRSALLREWQYRIVPPAYGLPPQAPWQPVDGLTTIYNAMIAPLGHLGLRAALWYQGESNTGDPHGYRALLTGLMHAWRRRFGPRLPFLIVQLPDYGPRSSTAHSASGWAAIRAAQRRAVLGDAHAALAVTIDIGEPDNLHPGDKQDVAKRLVRAARHLIYGAAIPPSGPQPTSATLSGARVSIAFTGIVGRLIAYSNPDPIGFELCARAAASCRFVRARIAGTHVMLSVPQAMTATRVRYCWGDSPICTLYDQSGLPAGPFQLALRRGHNRD